MDNRPFPDLRHIVRDAADDRIDVFAEWVSSNAALADTDQSAMLQPYIIGLFLLGTLSHQVHAS